MIESALHAIWFFLPAGLANMAPVLFRSVPVLDCPISKKFLGDHKTYRGFVAGILVAIAVVLFQKWLGLAETYLYYDYFNPYVLGFLMGAGAMTGDSVKSYFKRRAGIKPGQSWMFFDQVDWIFGAFLFLYFYLEIQLWIFVYVLVIFTFLHILMNRIRVYMKL